MDSTNIDKSSIIEEILIETIEVSPVPSLSPYQPENSLLSKMFYDQVQKPIKNYWFSVVKENLSELGLDCYSLNDIKIMKKYKFKNLVRSSCQDVAFRELKNKTKEKNLTKIKNIKYDNFEMKSYLLTNEITSLKKIVFRA